MKIALGLVVLAALAAAVESAPIFNVLNKLAKVVSKVATKISNSNPNDDRKHDIDINIDHRGLSITQASTKTKEYNRKEEEEYKTSETGVEARSDENGTENHYTDNEFEARRSEAESHKLKETQKREFSLGFGGVNLEEQRSKSIESTETNDEYIKNKTLTADTGTTDDGEYGRVSELETEEGKRETNRRLYEEEETKGFSLGKNGVKNKKKYSRNAENSKETEAFKNMKYEDAEYERDGDSYWEEENKGGESQKLSNVEKDNEYFEEQSSTYEDN